MQVHQINEGSSPYFTRVYHALDRYGLQYYLCVLNYIVVWAIYLKTMEPAYLTAYYFTLIYSGKLLPNDNFPVANSVEQNKSKLLLLPLVLQWICIWTTVIGIFITFPFLEYTPLQTILLTFFLMIIISVSIGAAHELMHRHEFIFKAMAKLQTAIALFTVYPYVHINFHHKHVGTETDFATCPKNKNTYQFAIQVLPKSYRLVYKNNKSQFYNCFLVNFAYIIGLFSLALYLGCSLKTAAYRVAYMVFVGLVASFLFEFVEATEHYGLLYRKNAQQKNVLEICSWNSQQNIILNWIAFRFQRHSDHHMNAYKIYSTTQLTEEMPKIPFSVFEAFLFCLIPPLWYKVMNPYVQKVMQGQAVSSSHKKWVQKIKFAGMLTLLTTFWLCAYFAYSGHKRL